jgi:hypothetical protein
MWFDRHAALFARFFPARSLRFLRGCRRLVRISLVQSERGINARLRNFDTEPHHSYCYEFEPDNRLESVANAHTAADLHVRLDP